MAVIGLLLLLLFLDFFIGAIFYGVGKLLLHPFRQNSTDTETAQQKSLNVLVGLVIVIAVLYGFSYL